MNKQRNKATMIETSGTRNLRSSWNTKWTPHTHTHTPQTREGFQQILGTTFEIFIQKSEVLGTPKILSRILKLQGLVEDLSLKNKTKAPAGWMRNLWFIIRPAVNNTSVPLIFSADQRNCLLLHCNHRLKPSQALKLPLPMNLNMSLFFQVIFLWCMVTASFIKGVRVFHSMFTFLLQSAACVTATMIAGSGVWGFGITYKTDCMYVHVNLYTPKTSALKTKWGTHPYKMQSIVWCIILCVSDR